MTDRLIYAALVAVWMAYLVPMGIRRYREVAARGSIASFSSTMVALAADPVRVAPGGTPPGAPVAGRGTSGATAAVRPSTSGVLDRPSARRAAARRRRVLFVLVGLVAVTAVLVVLTTLLWPAVLVPVALVVAFLVVSRVQVARQEHAAWTRAAAARAARPAPAPVPAAAPAYSRVQVGGDAPDDDRTVVIDGAAAVDLAARLARPAGATAYSAPEESVVAQGAHPAASAELQPAVHGAHPATAAHAASGAHAASNTADSAPAGGAHAATIPADPAPAGGAHPAPVTSPETWDLRPVTLPTYISKSRASRTVRAATSGGSGTWSSGRMQSPQGVRGERSDEAVQPRRAVGG